MISKRENLLYGTALGCAILFLLFGFIWIYWIALIVAYPLGSLSWALWLHLRKNNRKRNNIILYLLITGFVLSLCALMPGLFKMIK
jgi:hypothetical protein